ncbi:MAG: hypothetical protein JO032_11635 [Alphaproteobacteria bacterium]|nr:hypothetical protein [Alphaproteobacteria bacterium]
MTGARIILGGRELPIAPLKLGQLRALLDALDDLNGKSGGAVVDAAARVIQAGLAGSMPALSLDGVFELEATMDEVTEAVAVILTAAGLRRAQDPDPGEAAPVANPRPQLPAGAAGG